MPKLRDNCSVPFNSADFSVVLAGKFLDISDKKDRKMSVLIPSGVEVCVDKDVVSMKVSDSSNKSYLGLCFANVKNVIAGFSTPWTKQLEMKGVGYRASVANKDGKSILILSIGYSHPVHYVLPENVDVKVERNTIILLSSYDKVMLGDVAADLSTLRKYNPYKGKGVFIKGKYYPSKEMNKK